MKYLLMLLLSLTANAEQKQTTEPFSESLYREHSENIFLYMCEKTNDCLGTSAGWSLFDKVRGDGKYSCVFHDPKLGGDDERILVIDNYDKLLSLFAECRSNSINLIKVYKK